MSTRESIPAGAFDTHTVVYGMTGSGKSSAVISTIVEPELDAGQRVIIITPKDDWWGLRLDRKGKPNGYQIPIFGGRHKDYDLTTRDAKLLAAAYATESGSAIFCTAGMSVEDRAKWFSDFAHTFLYENLGMVRFVIDEAHNFMPKQGAAARGGNIPKSLHAGNALLAEGRSMGLQIVLASQRPAKLHNDASTQCEAMMAMKLTHPADRKAMKDWIAEQADPVTGEEIMSSLAGLGKGQAWVWAPSVNILARVQATLPKTFDSRKPGASAGPGDLPPINLDALKGKLAQVEAEKKANDPTALKAEVARLTRELGVKPKPETDQAAVDAARQAAYDLGLQKGHDVAWSDCCLLIEGFLEKQGAASSDFLNHLRGKPKMVVADHLKALPRAPRNLLGDGVALTSIAHPRGPSAAKTRLNPASIVAVIDPDARHTPAQQRLLNSLAFWWAIGDQAPTRFKVAAAAGVKASGGSFRNNLGALRSAGLIAYPSDGTVALTDTGAAVAERMTSEEAGRALRTLFTPAQARIADALRDTPSVISREELAGLVGVEAGGGSYRNNLGRLSSLDVAFYPSSGQVQMNEWARDLLSSAR